MVNYLLLWLLFILALCGGSNGGETTRNKPISTQLSAKWFNSPLLLEAAEYMTDESPATFWVFVNDVAQWDLQLYMKKNDEQKFQDLITSSKKILTEMQVKLLQLSLSLRSYSPKIEMFRQIAVDRGVLNSSAVICDTVVDINGKLSCSLDDLKQLRSSDEGVKPVFYDIDHRYPGGEDNKIGVILYSEIGTSSFHSFHKELVSLVKDGLVDYVLRPFVFKPDDRKVLLSGYGVELAIKSTEYKAQDDTKVEDDVHQHHNEIEDEHHTEGFHFSTLRSRYPDLILELSDFKKHLEQSSHEMAPMKVWQLQHLSMQAAQRVLSAGTPQEQLTTFTHISQDFPKLARGLTRIKVDDKMKREIIRNQNYLRSNHDVGPSDAALFVNGMHFDMDYTDIFTLLDHLKPEQRAMEGLSNLGISRDTLMQLLSLEGSSSEASKSVSGMFGSGMSSFSEYGLDIRDTAIIWLNDIETDSLYKRWPSSVTELLRPAFPGTIRQIRKNFHNLVLIVDPISTATQELFKLVDNFMVHNVGLRIGFVWSASGDRIVTGLQDPAVAIICAFNYVVQSFEGEEANRKGFEFLRDMYSSIGSTLSVDSITSYFKRRYKSEDLEDVFGSDSDFDVGRRVAKEFIEKGGFSSAPQALMNGVPLPSKQLSGDEFEELVLMEVMRNMQTFMRAVYKGDLDDRKDVVDWLMSAPNIMPRLNERILSTKGSRYIDMSGTSSLTLRDLREKGNLRAVLDVLPLRELTALVDTSCHYISAKAEPSVRPLTLWVLADYDTEDGRDLLLEAVKYTRESNSVRVCAVHHRSSSSISPGLLSRAVQIAQATLPAPAARQLLVRLLEPAVAHQFETGTFNVEQLKIAGFDPESFTARVQSLSDEVFELHEIFSHKVAGVTSALRTVIANGRVLEPLLANESLVLEDFGLLEKYSASTLTDKITDIVKDVSNDPLELSSLIMKVSGVLQTKPQSRTRTTVALKGTDYSSFLVPARTPSQPAFELVAVCDPVSQAAQKMAPVLHVLHQVFNANLLVVLNAVEKHSEMPLKSFYRVVLEPAPSFHPETGEQSSGPSAVFNWLPESPIFTQNLHVPENWLVEVIKSKYDLDNIKLEQVETGVSSEYELENLLVEGHCFEQSTGNPPRGLQFTLGTQSNPVMVDTIVMANLGYYQLKANPGAWYLNLREGRSKDIYDIVSHEGTDTPEGSRQVQVLVSSFRSHIVRVRVAKKPDKQDMDLLEENDSGSSGGLWNTITSVPLLGPIVEELSDQLYKLPQLLLHRSTFSGEDAGDAAGDSVDGVDTINIFSVASGHLYERFLRIMMLSVRRHTKAPVKFWFLKNFLSPSFKDSLPTLAEEYGFAYELVQYKWPRWLHQQTEKQRIIWGYKILFLDVLFPLHVRKIIFVDADQVVKADIKELYDLDLDGAPYGFVPFCDSRKEMEGFRFWKHGYWRNHLGNRKYHISALFVVDLKKFRRIAAGDRLRGQYQGLSQDPNSLSNLDQDLPNNMIHQVRINSLPMEWLWCETWCDDESKKYAKVIDLCNNPLTKEAKLDAAVRIIEEWTDYDDDIKRVLAAHRTNSSLRSGSSSNDHNKHTEL